MRITLILLAAAGLATSGCMRGNDSDVQRAVSAVNVVDESNLNDIMLTVGDPNEAVAYFQRAVGEQPNRIDLKRGLAKSLVKAQRPTEAVALWQQIIATPEATLDDRVGLVDALVRANEWKRAEAELARIPPTHETFERYKLEAMVADSKKDWKKADSFYEIASGLTTTPSGVLNNWGYSKLTRGDFRGAERLFMESLRYDPTGFTAKNNLVMARAGQRNYALPVVQMTQTERAQLLYTMALAAIKQGDVSTGRSLLHEAVETHPQHFEEAARALASLEGGKAAG